MQKLKLRLGNAVFAVVLAAAAIIFIAPILWMLSTALKEAEDIFPTRWYFPILLMCSPKWTSCSI